MNAKAPHAKCEQCPLQKMPLVPGKGAENPQLVIVGEAPGQVEVKKGEPFVGDSGRLLHATLQYANIAPEQIYVTNAVLCWPGLQPGTYKNAAPPQQAIDCCNARLIAEIKQRKAHAILVLGGTAAQAIKHLPASKVKITKLRGTRELHPQLNIPVMYTVHPAYILRNKEVQRDFMRDVSRALEDNRTGLPPTKKIDVEHVGQLKEMLANEMCNDFTCAYDLETEGLDPYLGKAIICLSLCFRPGEAYVVKENVLAHPVGKRLLNAMFAATNGVWAGTNLKFDNKWLLQNGFTPPVNYIDTMLLHYATDERRGTHGLKEQSQEFLGADDWESDIKQHTRLAKRATTKELVTLPSGAQVLQTLFDRIGYRVIPEQKLFSYAARDVDMNLQLLSALEPEIEKNPGSRKLYREILLPVSNMLTQIEHRGMLVNKPLLIESIIEYADESDRLTKVLQQIVGSSAFNPASPKQVNEYLYGSLGISPVKYNEKTHAPSTDAEAIAILADLYPNVEFVQLLSDWRAVNKILGTYLEPIYHSLDKNDRVHTSVLIHGTVSGRFSEKRWLLIPRPNKNKYAGIVRKLLIADPGYKLIYADYDQAELRVVTCEAQDNVFRQLFLDGGDPHRDTANLFYGTDWQVLPNAKEWRTKGKVVNFAVLYQAGVDAVAAQAGVSKNEAVKMMNQFRQGHKDIYSWIDRELEQLEQLGYVETKFDYRRRYDFISEKNWHEVKREAINFKIQSPANTLNTLAALQIHNTMPAVQVLLLCHDSIIGQAPENQVDEMAVQFKAVMETLPVQVYSDYVPFTADTKICNSWGDVE